MRTTVQLQPGFILHRRPYRDSSLLVEAFTRDYGRVGLVARGAKRGRAATAGLLEPFQPLLISWAGKGELPTLTNVELSGAIVELKGDELLGAFYITELMMRLLQRHISHSELFERYAEALGQLARGGTLEWYLRLFERDLLQELGYGLLLTHTADTGEEIQPQGRYCYHPEAGPHACEGFDDMGVIVNGRTLMAISNGSAADKMVLAESKRLMRSTLSLYLGDKPLASRELFRKRYSMKSSQEKQIG
jgi:DNA repair protein RecO (recombination protein O)